jgi:hypothetical protein
MTRSVAVLAVVAASFFADIEGKKLHLGMANMVLCTENGADSSTGKGFWELSERLSLDDDKKAWRKCVYNFHGNRGACKLDESFDNELRTKKAALIGSNESGEDQVLATDCKPVQ